jgi:hypothetical protein
MNNLDGRPLPAAIPPADSQPTGRDIPRLVKLLTICRAKEEIKRELRDNIVIIASTKQHAHIASCK